MASCATVDHGTKFTLRASDDWAYRCRVLLDHIRSGKSVENYFIESFNGKVDDECLNANQSLSIEDARCKIEAWGADHNLHRRHGSPGQLLSSELLRRSKTGIEKAEFFPTITRPKTGSRSPTKRRPNSI